MKINILSISRNRLMSSRLRFKQYKLFINNMLVVEYFSKPYSISRETNSMSRKSINLSKIKSISLDLSTDFDWATSHKSQSFTLMLHVFLRIYWRFEGNRISNFTKREKRGEHKITAQFLKPVNLKLLSSTSYIFFFFGWVVVIWYCSSRFAVHRTSLTGTIKRYFIARLAF